MDVLSGPPIWLIGLAIVISLYQGVRGFYFQWIHTEDQNRLVTPLGSSVGSQVGRCAAISMRCIPDAILYLVSTAGGFAGLFLAYQLLLAMPAANDISAGAAGLFVFLVLFGLLGVTGQLPHLLQAGRFIPK
jgi:hypothetical protein